MLVVLTERRCYGTLFHWGQKDHNHPYTMDIGVHVINFVAQTNQGGVMRTTFTYESILSAVGRVLDESGAKSIAIREDDDGLIIEGKNGAGEPQFQMHYRVADVYDLVTRGAAEMPSTTMDESEATTLHRFLAEHQRELIGAVR